MEEFTLEFSKFYQGYSPVAHINSLAELGNGGQAGAMVEADILDPTHITQGPGVANLTNGTQAGAVSELINMIMDRAVASDATYGIGATKLFKLSSTTVVSDATWPQAITSCTDGESVVELKGNLYYFFNKSSGGEIGKFDLASTFDHDWGSTVPTGAAALQKAPHPVEVKEDIMVFGNGRYLGVYLADDNKLSPTKLDFGNNNEVADVVFYNNHWLVAVNVGVSGSNRNQGQIYLYDGAALSSLLSDETAVGVQRIGFLFVKNGIVFVAYQDLSFSGGFKIGYISGKQIKDLGYFTGALPNFAQKTLYKNVILFVSSDKILAGGAVIEELPFAMSQLADGGYATIGALAAPFGTPMVASTDGGSNHRLAQFSGFSIASTWRSIIVPVIKGRKLGFIDKIIVLTKNLATGASCSLKIEANQAQSTSSGMTITTASKRRFVFTSKDIGLGKIEDLRIFLDWSGGSASADCAIRKIIINGHYVGA